MPDFDDIEIIKKIIHEEIRPAIQQHGGDIEFISFQDNIVNLKLHGACVNCPLSLYTLKLGIEEKLKNAVPSVQRVVAENL